MNPLKKTLLGLLLSIAGTAGCQAAADPNFWIFLCLGQSNMEGNARAEAIDKEYVDPRFQTLACVNFQDPQRTQGQWYTATPPIVRQRTNIGMADYFGRTMVAALPRNIRVGVVDVAIGGVAIEGFLEEECAGYLTHQAEWLKNIFAEYDNNPYRRLVDMARTAQQSGVIKAILLHQGETNNGQQEWLQKVKTIYQRLLADLNLRAEDVPLLAGETVNADVGGICAQHNTIIAQLPSVIPTAQVVSSSGCPCGKDSLHFTVAGYRTMGKRYATTLLHRMGQSTQAQSDYAWNANQKKIYQLVRLEAATDITIKVGTTRLLTVWGTFADGHREVLTNECSYQSDDFTLQGNGIQATKTRQGTVRVSYTDFTGQQHSLSVKVRGMM